MANHAEILGNSLRRAVICGLLVAGLTIGLSNAKVAAAEKPKDARPNILFYIGDDWGWPFCGALGDKVVRTPTFDRVAREGVLFPHTYCAAPSCTPSRASILTGQMFYRLETGAILWSTLPGKFPVYPDLLEGAGYHIGLTRKGWGPGDYRVSGWKRNPAGPSYRNFEEFLKNVPEGKPFCFWFGSQDPHRPYTPGSGEASGLKASDVQVPRWFPDVPQVRQDILDHYYEIERCDREIGEMLKLLEAERKLDNTMVVITGDNGWPFPRAKANLYDHGVRQPLAIRWPARVPGGRVVEDFISFCDFAPTFLEAAGLKPLPQMTGRSFLDVLTSDRSGRVDPARDAVVVGLEKHGPVFPMRAIRTHQYKYIRNFTPGEYSCCDGGPTKSYLLQHADDPAIKPLVERSFGVRPAEELYDMMKDPDEMQNLADDPAFAEAKKALAERLDDYLRKTADPRVIGGAEQFENAPLYRNPPAKTAKPKKAAR